MAGPEVTTQTPPLLTRAEIFSDIKRALHEELEEKGKAAPAQVAQAFKPPEDPVLAALALFSHESKAAPKAGEFIRIGDAGNVEVLTKAAVLAQASMSQGVLGGVVDTLDNVKIFNMALPLGSAIIGLPLGTIVGEVIDGLAPPKSATGGVNAMNLVAKGVGVWGTLQFGPKIIGDRASQFAVAAILVQVASQFLPLDQWVSQIVGAVRGAGKTVGIAKQYSAVEQAETVARQASQSQSAVLGQINHYKGAL